MSSSKLASSVINSSNDGSDTVIPGLQHHQQEEQVQEQQPPSPLSSRPQQEQQQQEQEQEQQQEQQQQQQEQSQKQQQHQHLINRTLETSENDDDSRLSSPPPVVSPVAAANVLPTTTGMPPLETSGQQHTNNATVNASPSPAPSAPVQAYAKLEGEDFCYYIRTLQVTLGRKAAASTPNNVDIPLGNTKSVSRHHARLFYNFTTQRFEMMVFGKNGALVNERFVECGATVPLENRTKIQIGDVAFVFLLPRLMDLDDKVNNGGTSDHGSGGIGNANGANDKDRQGDYISTPRQLEKNGGSDIITTTTLDHLNKKQRKRPLLQKKQRSSSSSATTTSTVTSGMDSGLSDEFGAAYNTPTPGSYNDKNIKPPYSYAAIIAQAINSCPEKKMTLSSIYAYITHQYPYYQMTQHGWQNSIRHNLSLNKAFIKVPRQKDEPGKGAFWAIDPNVDPQFLNGIYKRNKRSSPQQKSTPGDGNNDGTTLSAPGNDEDLPSTCPTELPPQKRIKLEQAPPPSPLSPTSMMHTDQAPATTKEEEDLEDHVKMEPLIEMPEFPSPLTTTTANTSEMNQIHTKETSSLIPPSAPPVTTATTTTTLTAAAMIPPTLPPPPAPASASISAPAAPSPSSTPISSSQVPVNDAIPSSSPPPPPPSSSSNPAPVPSSTSAVAVGPPPGMQTQLQIQLQQTIRQHLLDPIRNPLPPSIAQLLPQAIAQLPPALRTQLSATLQAALNAHQPQQQQQASPPPPPPPSTTTAIPSESSSSSLSNETMTQQQPTESSPPTNEKS